MPQRCVLADASGHFVYVLTREPDTAAPQAALQAQSTTGRFIVRRRAITLGQSVGTRWLVRAGLDEGDCVLVDGLQKVTSGGQVLASPLSPPAAALPAGEEPAGASASSWRKG